MTPAPDRAGDAAPRARRSVERYHGSFRLVTRTVVPECGAWMKRPAPTYRPTWPTPSKKTRSPGRSEPRATRAPRPKSAYELCGSVEPEVAVDVADEAGAVEPAPRRVAAVAVRDAEQPPRVARARAPTTGRAIRVDGAVRLERVA